MTSRSSKLLHIDPLAIALEKRKKAEELNSAEQVELRENRLPNTSSQPTLVSQPNMSSQPRLSSQPNMDPIKVNTYKENTHTQGAEEATTANSEKRVGVGAPSLHGSPLQAVEAG